MNSAIEVFIGMTSINTPYLTVVAFTHTRLALWLHDHANFVTQAVFVGFTFDETIGIFTFDWLTFQSSPRRQVRRSS